jgi:hypothetical protein
LLEAVAAVVVMEAVAAVLVDTDHLGQDHRVLKKQVAMRLSKQGSTPYQGLHIRLPLVLAVQEGPVRSRGPTELHRQ